MNRIFHPMIKNGFRSKPSSGYRGAFVIATFRRPEILEKVLNSIYNAELSKGYFKVIVFQGNDDASLKIINSFFDDMTILVRVSGKEKSPLGNITSNYMTGLSIAFDYCLADFAIEIEDDSVISPFALNFIEHAIAKYMHSPHFRGINLGSYEVDPELIGTYSKLRTGFHATHGVITRKSWDYVSKETIKEQIRNNPLDSTVEAYWKTGFVITPNLSLCENYGWVNGTHASSNSENSHYQNVANSFKLAKKPEKWELRNIKHSWEPKPVKYDPTSNVKFFLKYMLNSAWKLRLGRRLSLVIKEVKNQIKFVIGKKSR